MAAAGPGDVLADCATNSPESLIDTSLASDIFEYESEESMDTTQRLTSLPALTQAAECLRVLAHPHRLRMVQLLLQGEHTVTELAQACELPNAMASEHLRLMQRCGFLASTRDGRKVFYQVVEPHLKQILQCIEERFDSPAGA
jgi:ArsR family transcriptional regulator, zinc-responsive transcriptional repressor